MSVETLVCLVVLALWLPAAACALGELAGGFRFYRAVVRDVGDAPKRRAPDGRFAFQPPAVVILPCRGVDERLEQTVARVARQNFDDYEVIFAFESSDDPAHAAVRRWTATWRRPHRLVVAGPARQRSQKVHNLLAALAQVPPDREVVVFLDSDAVPSEDLLGFMVAPLAEPGVGAATGYRWYSSGGGLAGGLRCAWNAASLSLLEDERRAFCWGGATAIRKDTFDRLAITARWENSVSDDLQVTRAMRDAALEIRFVPQALLPSHETTTLRAFFSFARRQLVITRIYLPELWRSAFYVCLSFVGGGTAVAALCFAALFGWIGDRRVMLTALAGWLFILAAACGKAVLRQLAVRRVLRQPDLGAGDFWWDVLGAPLSGILHLYLLLSSLGGRRIEWRGTTYELVSPERTRVLGRGATAPL